MRRSPVVIHSLNREINHIVRDSFAKFMYENKEAPTAWRGTAHSLSLFRFAMHFQICAWWLSWWNVRLEALRGASEIQEAPRLVNHHLPVRLARPLPKASFHTNLRNTNHYIPPFPKNNQRLNRWYMRGLEEFPTYKAHECNFKSLFLFIDFW